MEPVVIYYCCCRSSYDLYLNERLLAGGSIAANLMRVVDALHAAEHPKCSGVNEPWVRR